MTRLGRIRVALLAMGTVGFAVAGASPVRAQTLVQSGWWSMAAPGPLAAPAPGTSSSELQVSAVSGRVLAFSAVLFQIPTGTPVVLRLAVTRVQGMPGVRACPITTQKWAAGPDQPASSAPSYDCTRSTTGAMTPDGSAMTFAVSRLAARDHGPLSLALVPAASTFVLDFQAPSADALTVALPAASGATAAPATTPFSGQAISGGQVTSQVTGLPASTAVSEPASTVPSLPSAATPALAPAAAGNSGDPGHPVAASASIAFRSGASTPTRRRVGETIGVIAYLAALLTWAGGRGLLGGRIKPLSDLSA